MLWVWGSTITMIKNNWILNPCMMRHDLPYPVRTSSCGLQSRYIYTYPTHFSIPRNLNRESLVPEEISVARQEEAQVWQRSPSSHDQDRSRTKTFVKGAIGVLVDAHPFKEWYETHYGVKVGVKKGKDVEEKEAVKQSNSVVRKIASRQKGLSLESSLDSRPGQSGRCDGIVLEGPELVFYQKMMATK